MCNNWINFWQVKVSSSNVFKVDTVEGEEELQELERFSFWGWFQSLLREQQNETTINISLFNKRTCFKINTADETQYTVKPLRSKWKTDSSADQWHVITCLMWCLLFPCRFWYLSVLGIPRWCVVVHLCRFTQQVTVFFQFRHLNVRVLQGYNTLLIIFPHMKESSFFLLCWNEHRNDSVSHHPLFHFGTLSAKGNGLNCPQVSISV